MKQKSDMRNTRIPHAQKTAPDTLVKLGCTVEDLRTSITGEKSGREKQCREALAK